MSTTIDLPTASTFGHIIKLSKIKPPTLDMLRAENPSIVPGMQFYERQTRRSYVFMGNQWAQFESEKSLIATTEGTLSPVVY